MTWCLSGCSALRISTTEGDSQPVSVGVDDGSQVERSREPEGPAVPLEMDPMTVDLGSACPVEMQLAMGGGRNDDLAYGSYQLYSRDNGAIITVNCYEDDDATAQSLVEKAQEQTFGESQSSIMDETSGAVTGGVYWTFHGQLARQEIRAIDETASVLFGAVAGIADNGRLYKVSVEMVTVAGDHETEDLYAQMLLTVSFAGQALESPALS